MLEDILLQVNKPGRYIGGEWNSPKKDFNQTEIKFALCFPDLYEVGMSNLGARILYNILNNLPDVSCERFFCVAGDMEKILRDKQVEIFSLESKRGLKEFDIVGFSLGYELNYTNVLNILELGAIPLWATLRNQSHPLVIAGGPCALNPEPMHAFFDLFVIGEAEEVILEIIQIYRQFKSQFKAGKINKQDLLTQLVQIEGVYVPSLYEVIYNAKGKIEEFKPKINGIPQRIKKRFLRNLESVFPLDWLLPHIQIVHDRITLEIMRGCPNACRFCQARPQYFPFRQRSHKFILEQAFDLYQRTGYEEISLAGLSVSDYFGIEELLKDLVDLFKAKAVSVSLPSLKPKDLSNRNLSSFIATIKKTGLTFAPEAAAARLRKILNKEFDTIDFFKAIEQAYADGWQHIKLYFMIGIPSEEEKDLDAILDLAYQASELRRKIKAHPARINISINTLIPKPHTPFQWLKMENLEHIRYKQDYLKKKIKNKRFKLNLYNPRMSFLEAVLSRGDRRLSEVIASAFRRGARFDAWNNYFDFDKWEAAFKECRIAPEFYLDARDIDECLPWDFLDTGISNEALITEFNKILL
jgi:radical SAM family uncharacterized protein